MLGKINVVTSDRKLLVSVSVSAEILVLAIFVTFGIGRKLSMQLGKFRH